jgi:hypothetical protein
MWNDETESGTAVYFTNWNNTLFSQGAPTLKISINRGIRFENISRQTR